MLLLTKQNLEKPTRVKIMSAYSTVNMKYVLVSGDDKIKFDLMSELMNAAIIQEDHGNGFFCYIEHTILGKVEIIPFVA